MNGKVKMYNKEKGFGFILGEDGNDYFFHISDVVSIDDIESGMRVEFIPRKNNKGNHASNVQLSSNRIPLFITLGDVRIKLNNIKNYGMSQVKRYVITVYKYKSGIIPLDILTPDQPSGQTVVSEVRPRYRYYCKRGGEIMQSESEYHKIYESDYVTKYVDYLYVTTYQDDNFMFVDGEVDFDIHAKFKEIDRYLT